MARLNVSPTRMELTKLKKRLTTARKGHKLMKDKRDELMKKFLDLIRKNQELRLRVEKLVSESEQNFVIAGARLPDVFMDAALCAPSRKISVSFTEKNMMGVVVPEFKYKIEAGSADLYGYGFADTDESLDAAVASMDSLLPSLLELASVEKSCQLMAAEIEHTRRRVNALEYVMIPQLEETIRYITMKMEENDRSTKARLMKVKEMVLENK